MRTTVNIEPQAYSIARAVAHQKNQSIGKVVSDALMQAYSPENDRPIGLYIDERGWPVIHLGRPITPEEVAEAIAED